MLITRHPSWPFVCYFQCLEQCKDNKTTIGNWIQCREVLDSGVVCGKWRRYIIHSKFLLFSSLCLCWHITLICLYAFFTAWTFRRAPLFVVQSSDWDCSCSVVWDPIHADCAVPQVHSANTFLWIWFCFLCGLATSCLFYVIF